MLMPCRGWWGEQVATFIVQKILLDDMGLNYICATAERFFAVSRPRAFVFTRRYLCDCRP
jgi:hypothetical protein